MADTTPANAAPSALPIPARATPRELGSFLTSRSSQIKAIAASNITPQRLAKIAVREVSKNPALAKCTGQSVFRAVLACAELGLEPGSSLGEAYLVPFKTECQLIIGYRGLATLAWRSGFIRAIRVNAVYEGDDFEYEDGYEVVLKHTPRSEPDAKKLTHVYCVIDLQDGGKVPVVMTRAEVERIKRMSRASSRGPWVDHYAEMAKKTVVRRTLKLAPMSVELVKAVSHQDAMDIGEDALADLDAGEIIDIQEEPEEKNSASAALEKKLENGEQAQGDEAQPELEGEQESAS